MKKGHVKRKIRALYRQKIILGFVILLLIQLALVLVSRLVLDDNEDALNYGDAVSATVTVEKVKTVSILKFTTKYRHSPRSYLCFYSNGKEYAIEKINKNEKISDLEDVIHVGDKFDVISVEGYLPQEGDVNFVVDIRDENEVYRSLDDLINKRLRNFSPAVRIAFWIGVEVFYALIVTIYIWINSNMLYFSK